jgi:catechol 2,3-dioxygenase-like lactoylglutathione lyase family enzyme
MENNILVQHVAVECCSQQHADRFFSSVLGLRKVKSTLLSKELSMAIFKIDKEVQFDFYDNGKTRFEVFINDEHREPSYAHICIEVEDKSDFMSRCKEQGLDPFFVEKGGKQLLFVRDFSSNLFEVLESNLNQ